MIHIGNTVYVINNERFNLPKRIEFEDNVVLRRNNLIELDGKFYRVEPIGVQSGEQTIYLDELYPIKARGVDNV